MRTELTATLSLHHGMELAWWHWCDAKLSGISSSIKMGKFATLMNVRFPKWKKGNENYSFFTGLH